MTLWKPIAVVGRIALIAALLRTPCVRAGQVDENELKATFVLHFLRLVRWSASAESDGGKLEICALANSDLFASIKNVAKDKEIGGRTVSATVNPDPSPSTCRVLVVDAEQYARAGSVMKRFQNTPVLTVGNGPGFLKIGGMFELVVAESRVQFDVNMDPIRHSRLEVSARLLRLARNLQPGGLDVN